MVDSEVYGAFASVHIRFDGKLRDLAERVGRAFNIGGLNVERSEFEPYDEIGSAEALGWEVWLQARPGESGLFDLRLATEHATDEAFHGRMHDLSPWLARFVAMMCDL